MFLLRFIDRIYSQVFQVSRRINTEVIDPNSPIFRQTMNTQQTPISNQNPMIQSQYEKGYQPDRAFQPEKTGYRPMEYGNFPSSPSPFENRLEKPLETQVSPFEPYPTQYEKSPLYNPSPMNLNQITEENVKQGEKPKVAYADRMVQSVFEPTKSVPGPSMKRTSIFGPMVDKDINLSKFLRKLIYICFYIEDHQLKQVGITPETDKSIPVKLVNF